ncbi:dTDP-4-dehydrorhamnose 3,5-epimerase [Beijerinckia mobilis]|uniref:dTDP-4-dehydrorhamnose 3,5-epimerase n=1 Tax=Beijerinckia mobilis TaxID=231434 RepID=UPI0006906DBE|nr:dTDP-4-dehydrorhamnose 3,5-epimerase [Beijerinckia mobilis]
MIFHQTPLVGAYLIELEKHADDRGFFARFYCENEFKSKNLVSHFVQINNSLSVRKGTLRGFHYQIPPAAEVKIVRCIRGALYDVIVDIRPSSETFGKWFGIELNSDNRLMMYVPRGFAHGFITLKDETETFYLVSDFYSPKNERGIRFDDPWIKAEWPLQPIEMSERDKNLPYFEPMGGDLADLHQF